MSEHPAGSRTLMAVLIGTLTLSIIVVAALLIYRNLSSRTATASLVMGSVDLAQLVKEEDARVAALLGRGTLSQAMQRDALTQRAEQFGRALDGAIAKLPEQCGCTVLNAAAILAVPATNMILDLTSVVRAQLVAEAK